MVWVKIGQGKIVKMVRVKRCDSGPSENGLGETGPNENSEIGPSENSPSETV